MADTMVQDRTVTGVLQFTVPTGEKIITQVSAKPAAGVTIQKPASTK